MIILAARALIQATMHLSDPFIGSSNGLFKITRAAVRLDRTTK